MYVKQMSGACKIDVAAFTIPFDRFSKAVGNLTPIRSIDCCTRLYLSSYRQEPETRRKRFKEIVEIEMFADDPGTTFNFSLLIVQHVQAVLANI
ncbi:hypothetical protein B9Z38_16550 [Limnohabitans sp. MMS-10A-160]|nr:hypothetical protein B9Z43_16705 [Limnohabitans sp. MMS-10A-192]PUE20409.1 hypothetical protein B9Z38_16550 [Limnohabitans sp. MMS-10A-160]